MPSALAIPRELTHVQQNVRNNHRPFKWRSIMKIARDIPEWADKVETTRITSQARLVPTDDYGPSELPVPSLERETETLNLYEFGAAYKYFDREILKARKLEVNLPMEQAAANWRAAEQLLDETAASGDPFGKGLRGLGNQVGITPVVASDKGSGNTEWTTATVTADLLIEDCFNIMNAVETQSLETQIADTLILSLTRHQILLRTRVPDTSMTAMQLFREQWRAKGNGEVRIMVWDRFSVLGAGGTERACAFNSRDKNVCQFLLPKEYGADQPRRISRGWEVDETLIMGGVQVLDQSGIAYMDEI